MIDNMDNYYNSLWNWSFLAPMFNGSKPSDIDGILHCNGNFLAIETKFPLDNGKPLTVRKEQLEVFRGLVATGAFTVIIAWGNGRNHQTPYVTNMWVLTKWGDKPLRRANTQDLQHQAARWYKWALKNPYRSNE